MSKRERFLGSKLKEGISEALKDGSELREELNNDIIPIDRIELDELNARKTGFSMDEILTFDVSTCNDKNKIESWKSIVESANSIKAVGLLQMIEVYRHKDKFKVIFGERRVLASILAGKKNIWAKIHDVKPSNLRIRQYIENLHRANLTCWQHIVHVERIIEDISSEQGDKVKITTRYLADIVGMKPTQVHVYMSIINGPEDVKILLRNGELSNLDKASFLAKIKNDKERKYAISLILNGIEVDKVKEKLDQSSDDKKFTPTKTYTRINLGQTNKVHIIKKIMSSVTHNDDNLIDMNAVDWLDIKSVSKYWKLFLKKLEIELEHAAGDD